MYVGYPLLPSDGETTLGLPVHSELRKLLVRLVERRQNSKGTKGQEERKTGLKQQNRQTIQAGIGTKQTEIKTGGETKHTYHIRQTGARNK